MSNNGGHAPDSSLIHLSTCGCDAHRGPSRRSVLAGAAGLAAGAATGALAQGSGKPKRPLIDIHHHVTAPRWTKALQDDGQWGPPVSNISIQKILDDMDRDGVSVCVNTLVASPKYIWVDSATDRAASRDANEYMTKLVKDYPGRFGTFASLPISDIDASLKEIEYALDTLKVDGFQLLTSYENHWIGDAYYEPVLAELNRRKTILYTHPHESACCRNPLPDIVNAAFIEFGTDTARAITRYIFSGSAAKFADLKVIFSHAGGTMPYIMTRFVNQVKDSKELQARLPNGLDHEVQKLYYDTAQAYYPVTLKALRNLVPASQILFGTDFPYRTATETLDGVVKSGAFTSAELTAIESGNARKMLPGLPTSRL